jgi:excisionase family DNA binding protein
MNLKDENYRKYLSHKDSKPVFPWSLLTVKEVQRHLSVSRSSVYNLIETGNLPAVRIGSSVRVTRGDLWKFIETRRVSTAEASGSEGGAA